MTSSSLQFGPEWMRKAPAKAATPSSAAPPTLPTTGQQQQPPTAKRNTSLGSMNGPAPVMSPSAVPSPGAFSFAAAAAGGKGPGASTGSSGSMTNGLALGRGGSGASIGRNGGSSVASAVAADAGGPTSLSLYSSKEGSRGGSLSPGMDVPPSTSTNTGASNIATEAASAGQTRKKLFGSTGREFNQRPTSNDIGAGGALSPSLTATTTPTIPAEPRGLNARGASTDRERPGLFTRASSSSILPKADTSHHRERFSGIQGGVLSGVAPPERRRKESTESRTPRHAAPEEATLWERRGGENKSATNPRTSAAPEAFASAARFRSKPSLEGLSSAIEAGNSIAAGEDKVVASPSATTPLSHSSSGRRRERTAGEGPIGPPSDGSAGFSRFAGYERKRERMASHTADSWRAGPTNGVSESAEDDPSSDKAADSQAHAPSSQDPVDEAATALQRAEISESRPDAHLQDRELPAASDQQQMSSWSPESQQWHYRDPSGQVQGPFAGTLMQDWYEQNYFTNDLLIRPQEQSEFRPLVEFVAAMGHNPKPFLIAPPPMEVFRQQQQAAHLPPSLPAHLSDFNAPFPSQPHPAWDAQQQMHATGGWPAQQHLGFGGPGPMSPFASGPFGGIPFGAVGHGDQLGLDARLQQQDAYLASIRQREIEEQQRQAASRGLSFGQFPVNNGAGVGGWPGQSSIGQQPWGSNQGSSEAGGHQSPWAQPNEASFRSPARAGAPWEAVQPIGTPVRARSPVNASSLADEEPEAQSEHVAEAVAAQLVEDSPKPAAAPVQEVADQATREETLAPEPAAMASEEEARPPTPQPEDPAPEHEWPQSPSAVEFATEPDYNQGAGQDFSADRKAAGRPGAGKPGSAAVQSRSNTGPNVRVVGADQFRRGSGAGDSTSVQAPLSSFVSGSGASATAPAAAKAAPWAQQSNDTDSASAMSLREIQQAEAKQAEARRAAEAARRQAAAAAAASSSNGSVNSLPSTMSWGLASVPAKNLTSTEAAVASPASSAPAPWASSKTTPKKTLAEIQEEERKRALAQQQLKQAAARTAFADTASRQAPPSSTPQPGWSVVGAGGRASTAATPAATTASRPSALVQSNTRTASSTSIPGVAGAWGSSGATASKSTLPPTPAARTVSKPSTANTTSVSSGPSPEFLRYCKEQLKGLNVKVDDFIEMLLSFPVDPSPDVVEIIADSIYANSSTLDGRRLANDFVAKRKMDAGLKSSASPASGTNAKTAVNGSASQSVGGSVGTAGASSGKGSQHGFQQVVKKGGKKRAN